MAPPKKNAKPTAPNQTVKAKTLTELVQYSARLAVERDALQAVLENGRVRGWRDAYNREFQERWENQGTAFDVIYAHVRGKRVEEVLQSLVQELGKHVGPDE